MRPRSAGRRADIAPQPSLMAQVAARDVRRRLAPLLHRAGGDGAACCCSRRTPRSTASRCSARVLARDGYAPKALSTRGDRLIFTNGVIVLSAIAAPAAARLPGERHEPDPAVHHRRLRLVHPRADGHGPALDRGLLKQPRRAGQASSTLRSLAINLVGASMTATVLVIVTITKFTHGAWLVLRDHADPLVPDARREPVLPRRREGDRGRPAHDLRLEGRPRDRARRPDAEAGAEGDRLRDRREARHARGRARLHRRRGDAAARGRVGADEHLRAADRRALAVPRHQRTR